MVKVDNHKTIRMLTGRFLISYKKRTLAMLLSFTLIISLMTCLLTLLHTNSRLESLQNQATYTPADIYVNNLTYAQACLLEKEKQYEFVSIGQNLEWPTAPNGQHAYLIGKNSVSMTEKTTVLEGRLPQSSNEIVAEKWVLMNLGIVPKVGTEFTLKFEAKEADSSSAESKARTKTYKVVGILNDMAYTKLSGILEIYTILDKNSKEPCYVYLKLKNGREIEKEKESISRLLQIPNTSKRIQNSIWAEDYKKLDRIDGGLLVVIWLLSFLILYGLYRISMLDRENQYGMLRSIGVRKGQIRDMIFRELFILYAASICPGTGMGILVAQIIRILSKDDQIKIYLYNRLVSFQLVIPGFRIAAAILVLGGITGIIGRIFAKKIAKKTIMETINGSNLDESGKSWLYKRRKKKKPFSGKSHLPSYVHLGVQYLIRDRRTTLSMILFICIGSSLFYGLYYKGKLEYTINDQMKDMTYLNGDYEISTVYKASKVTDGLSWEDYDKMREIPGITGAKIESSLPVRVVDDKKVKRNEEYLSEKNQWMIDNYGYSLAAYDGKEQVYHSALSGYNVTALKKLKKYLSEGDFNPQNLPEDEIILCVSRIIDKGKDKGIFCMKQAGSPLFSYKVGDKIRIKYRSDYETDGDEYWQMKDEKEHYIYKEYKIAAIVCWSYMEDMARPYPLLITSDKALRKLIPESRMQQIYLDEEKKLQEDPLHQDKNIEKLIIIGSGKSLVIRSLTGERERYDRLTKKQLVYVFSIAFTTFLLITMNLMNQLKYRVQIRKKEIAIYRTLGMTKGMVQKMIGFENAVIGLAALFLALGISIPVSKWIYSKSYVKFLGISMQFDKTAFIVVSIFTMVLCFIISKKAMKPLEEESMIEAITDVE